MITLDLTITADLEAEAAVAGVKAEAATATTEAAARMKQALRDQVTAAGLGDRLAKTWRSSVTSTEHRTTATVVTTAPVIIGAFDQGATIVARNGSRWLAIPTAAVPRRPGRGSGRRLTPVEVEALYNRDLRTIPARAGPNAYLVMDFLIAARSGRGYRAATAGRLAQGRRPESVLMFVLVPQVTLTKRLDVARVLAGIAAEFPELSVTPLS